jgi:hypothetical protein
MNLVHLDVRMQASSEALCVPRWTGETCKDEDPRVWTTLNLGNE